MIRARMPKKMYLRYRRSHNVKNTMIGTRQEISIASDAKLEA
jgi:hypothetical protein